MKFKIFIIFIFIFFGAIGLANVFALEHSQKNGLFSMDIPADWHWMEYPQDIVITFPDGKTMAIDIQMGSNPKLSGADIKKMIKEANDKMIKDGIEAHGGTLLGNKDINLSGAYATQIDFKTGDLSPVLVTYISSFYKGYALTITYGSADQNIKAVMDDAVATFKFR